MISTQATAEDANAPNNNKAFWDILWGNGESNQAIWERSPSLSEIDANFALCLGNRSPVDATYKGSFIVDTRKESC